MQLHVVVVPPPDVVDDALNAARQLFASAPTTAKGHERGLLGRLLGRREPADPTIPSVTVAPGAPETAFVRLAKIGNVSAGDATGLAAALEAVAGTWRIPILHVSKVSVSEAAPFDVSAELDGDTDALHEVFRNVHEVARLERFFLDRRSFRTALPLGTVTTADGSPVADDVAGRTVEHRGPRWSPTHITLLRTTFTADGTTFAEFARVDLSDNTEEFGASAGARA